jgi:hypothetical protein
LRYGPAPDPDEVQMTGPMAAQTEFDRQVATLVAKGYPEMADRDPDQLVALLEPLRAEVLERVAEPAPPSRERVPFVLTISARLVPAARMMPRTELAGRPGFVSADTGDIDRFKPIEAVPVPDADAWVVYDVERGSDLVSVRPDDALVAITARGRTPLTVEEGIAFVTHHPGSLEKNHCFSLLASRCGDRRVPALWISDKAPKLGWCWAGNPHSWLGSASCGGRSEVGVS